MRLFVCLVFFVFSPETFLKVSQSSFHLPPIHLFYSFPLELVLSVQTQLLKERYSKVRVYKTGIPELSSCRGDPRSEGSWMALWKGIEEETEGLE